MMESDWRSLNYLQQNFVALGTLISRQNDGLQFGHLSLEDGAWKEVETLQKEAIPSQNHEPFYRGAPHRLEAHVRKLLLDGRIRIFAHMEDAFVIHRIYLLAADATRSRIGENVTPLPQALQSFWTYRQWPSADLERILPHIDTSSQTWHGNSNAVSALFDPWATAEEGSLFYVFNTLPSPSPDPTTLQDPFVRETMEELLDYSVHTGGLKTHLYPYQARSAAQMIHQETCRTSQLDPRYESRYGPDGLEYYYSPRAVAFCKTPPMFDSTPGGILAETMGLGKTIICLAVILATRGHSPRIPSMYEIPDLAADSVPSLMQLALRSAWKAAIPVRPKLERLRKLRGVDYSTCLRTWDTTPKEFLVPGKPPRSLRKNTVPPPRKMTLSVGTIIVCPRNLVHQWRAEMRKHLASDESGLRILIMDDPNKKMPPAEELRLYDVLLFSKPRFEREAADGVQSWHRREIVLDDHYHPVNYYTETYESPLRSLHFLRIIIDEGHEFSSASSNAVLVAEKVVSAERRWVVSGTPARDKLYGVEVDLAGAADEGELGLDSRELTVPSSNGTSNLPEAWTPVESETSFLGSVGSYREELDRRKAFNMREEVGSSSAARSLGLLARHFLKASPWYTEVDNGLNWRTPQYCQGSVWDEHIYRHEHHQKKTYTCFSKCLRQTLQSLVVKTRPEDVERDIALPSLHHKVVRLEPSFYDKLTANLFVLFLTANTITSEREDVDYLFHKKSAKARHRLINNLRQSGFFWTGFDNEDVSSVIDIGNKYLEKKGNACPAEDKVALENCLDFAKMILENVSWSTMNIHHDLGLFLQDWPREGSSWAMSDSEPPMIGIAQLIHAQTYVNNRLLLDDPFAGFDGTGLNIIKTLEETNAKKHDKKSDSIVTRAGLPKSGLKREPLASKYRTPTPKKAKRGLVAGDFAETDEVSPTKSKSKRRKLDRPPSTSVSLLTGPELDRMELDSSSDLLKPSIIGTASAKLSYLIDRIVELHAQEKIIVFFDGENAAFYLAQCLELLHIKFLIYSRTLSNEQRSRYIVTFDAEDSIRVLLMDIRAGAYGLNVNKASRVFFINPVCRPSTEAQAIKRAHRIGQTRTVYVETLVLNGTIEAGMFERSKNMTQAEHQEAAQFDDDQGVARVIQNAKLIPVSVEEGIGEKQMAKLSEKIRVFGRAGRGSLMKIKGIDKELDMIPGGIPMGSVQRAKASTKGWTLKTGEKDNEMPNESIKSYIDWMRTPFVASTELRNDDSTVTEAQSSVFG